MAARMAPLLAGVESGRHGTGLEMKHDCRNSTASAIMKKMLKVAIAGLGGFARAHHEALSILKEEGVAELIATCDPRATPEVGTEIETQGVAFYPDFIEMLDASRDELDFVTVPTPIPLHAPMHRASVERGLGVYLEKPPTLDWQELESMIEVDKTAPFATQVGFNFIVETPRQQLKARLLAGEFGALRLVGFLGCWPRSTSYFQRAGWAGKLQVGGKLILDSCVGNAMAHYVHNVLFWCGTGGVLSWGEVSEIEAELYRAHAIGSFDTVFARGNAGGTEIHIGATHAASDTQWQQEWLECEKANIRAIASGAYRIEWHDGHLETTESNVPGQLLARNIAHYTRYLTGQELRPLTTLADSRPFVQFNDLLFIAAKKIVDVPTKYVNRKITSADELVAISQIEDHLQRFGLNGLLPSECGIPWAQPGGTAVASDISMLQAVIDSMTSIS
jgi:predicted dehydrogenase